MTYKHKQTHTHIYTYNVVDIDEIVILYINKIISIGCMLMERKKNDILGSKWKCEKKMLSSLSLYSGVIVDEHECQREDKIE